MNESGQFTIKDILFDRDQDPDHNAIECPGFYPLTYRDLRLQIKYVVKALNSLGFHRNDRIAIIMPAGPETAVTIISVMAGFTAVPLNPQARDPEYSTYFSQLKINAVIVRKGYETAAFAVAKSRDIPVIELVPVPGYAGKFDLEPYVEPYVKEAEFAGPSDIAILLFTSGTTGMQKIAPVTQKQFLLSKQKQADAFTFTRADRSLHLLPYHHAMGLSTPLLCTWLAGGTVICTIDFIPADFLPLLRTYRPTFYSAGPALHQAILREIKKVQREELKGNSLQKIQSATAPLSSGVHQELERLLGVPVTESYGMAEAGMIAINLPPRTGSVGVAIIESLTIRDENGSILTGGETGEIVVRGETVFDGYEDAPEENKAVFTDGGFRTGDMGYLDFEGYLFITGRKKEMINKGGQKISPAEVDAVLMACPGVAEAMTFPVEDPVFGEEIAALVVRKEKNLSEEDLRLFLLDRLTASKIPRRILFVDRIPKTLYGKPIRYEGTQRYSYENPETVEK
jgi:acyl-CoA synthetase (AMP-forming)/AMP-acid ligase II